MYEPPRLLASVPKLAMLERVLGDLACLVRNPDPVIHQETGSHWDWSRLFFQNDVRLIAVGIAIAEDLPGAAQAHPGKGFKPAADYPYILDPQLQLPDDTIETDPFTQGKEKMEEAEFQGRVAAFAAHYAARNVTQITLGIMEIPPVVPRKHGVKNVPKRSRTATGSPGA